MRTINHHQPKQRCTAQALSELSALVPTGEKTVSLRSGHNGRRQWAGIMSMPNWMPNMQKNSFTKKYERAYRRQGCRPRKQNQQAPLDRQRGCKTTDSGETHSAKRRPKTVEFTPRAQVRAADSGQRIKRQQKSTKALQWTHPLLCIPC